jgi:hypothetical protein
LGYSTKKEVKFQNNVIDNQHSRYGLVVVEVVVVVAAAATVVAAATAAAAAAAAAVVVWILQGMNWI